MISRVLLQQDTVQLQTAYWTDQNIQDMKFEYLIIELMYFSSDILYGLNITKFDVNGKRGLTLVSDP